jgi:hypothetical protein
MKISILPWMAAALMLLASCTSSDKGFRTESRTFDQSSDHAQLTLDATLPVATTPGAAVMRQTLVDVMDQALCRIDSEDGKRLFPRFEGDINDSEALFSYYEQQGLAALEAKAKAFADMRAEGIRESTTLTDEEKEKYIAETPGYGFGFHLDKVHETDKIAVFDSENYIYLGGAHGGITGEGPMTFDKQSGMRLRAFFEPGSEVPMQPLLRKGMLSYFQERMEAAGSTLEMHLHLRDDGLIPLPQWAPMPTADGLKFIYQQYEVTAYVDGMPEFTLTYDEVAPYLLPEAKADLGL